VIELASREDQARVIEVSSDWELARSSPLLRVHIGEEDFSDRVPVGDITHEGIALTLDLTFAGSLPLRLYGAPVLVSLSIDGALIPLMSGHVSLPEPNDDLASTKLLGASTGSLADKYPLNERVEYSGVRPDYVVRDALRRLPYFLGTVRVEALDGPLLYFAKGGADGPFEADQNVNDILSKVAEKVAYLYRDTANGGHAAGLSVGLAKIPELPESARFHAEKILFWKSPSLALEQYAQVIVWQDNPDGSPAFDPAIAKVYNQGRDFPAGLTMRIPFTGTNADEAWQRAYEKANELGRGLFKSEPILPFKPLLERTDIFSVTEVKEEEGATYEREWLHYVDSYKHDWNLGEASSSGFQTQPTCSATLLREERIKAPLLLLGLIGSAGILQTPPLPIYSRASGVWYEPSTAVNTAHEPWIGLDSTGAWIDESLAGEYAGVDSQGFWLDFG
jgi:hypothetical protein